jgi:peptidoglycan/LPS O-acetylase OafA/YrhL
VVAPEIRFQKLIFMSSSSDSSPSGEPPKASPAQPKSGARLIQLDVLRGVAILMVLACHFSTRTKLPGAGALQIVHTTFMRLDAPGVDLFFVLSGFLVGGLLFGEIRARGSLDVKRFLIRRAFKIWPLYYLYVFAMMP